MCCVTESVSSFEGNQGPPAGRQVSPAGRQVNPAGRQVSPTGSRSGGAKSSASDRRFAADRGGRQVSTGNHKAYQSDSRSSGQDRQCSSNEPDALRAVSGASEARLFGNGPAPGVDAIANQAGKPQRDPQKSKSQGNRLNATAAASSGSTAALSR